MCLYKSMACRRSARAQPVSPSSGKGLCLAASNRCKQFLRAPWEFAGEESEAKRIKNLFVPGSGHDLVLESLCAVPEPVGNVPWDC